MWTFRTVEEVSEEDIQKAVTKGYLTQQEAEQIIATPKQV